MKRFTLFLMPLIAISFLTNCNSGPKLYTVAFDSNGGSAIYPQTVIENQYATKPADPTREDPDDMHGYVLDEWQLDGVVFDFNTPITKDINLKATWNIVNKYTVTFDTGEGGSIVPSQKVLENHYATKPADPTHTSSESIVFTFARWEKSDGTIFDFEHTSITGNITLTAKWIETTREYDITFNPGEGKWKNGSTNPIVKKVKYGDTPTCESPVKSSDDQYDYLFSNWDKTITIVTGPKTYTAVFTKSEKNVTNLVVDFPSDATNKTIAFEYGGTLNNVDWGDGQTSNGKSSHTYNNVGQYAINIHGDLTNFSLTNELSKLCSDGNKYVKSIKLKNGITSIGKSAFSNCSSLTSINIPNSVTSIDVRAFDNCSSLTSINIPNSVTSIGVYVFDSCSSLTSMVVDPDNPNYDSRDNCNAIISKQDNTLLYGCQNTIIPTSVTAIGEGAFSNCSSLTTIVIPSSIVSIRGFAFSDCYSLTSIFIPSSVTTMGYGVFDDCNGLTEIRCQAKEKPSGWDDEWYGNVDYSKIRWGQSQLTNNTL